MKIQSSVNSSKRLPVAYKQDFGGVFLSLIADTRHDKLDQGVDVPIAVRVSYDKEKKYFRTGMKVSTTKEFLSFANARDSRPDRKEQIAYFNLILDAVKSIMFANKGKFSLERLQEDVAKGFTSAEDDTFTYWEKMSAGKEKRNTRVMYDMALKKFRQFRKDKPIQLSDVTTEVIGKFNTWLSEQKSATNPCKMLSLDTRMMIMRAIRAVMNQAKNDGMIDTVPEFKNFMHTGNRRRANALQVEDVLKLWDYWCALDAKCKQTPQGKAVGHWLLLYSLNGMNTVDMAKLTWDEKSSISEEYPQLSFIRSKIDRANNPKGKQLDVTVIPVIPQLRMLLDAYASEYQVGMPVFPQIFLGASTAEARANRLHDFGRLITKNIAPVCESLGIQRITPQYSRNSFISALAHHGVMTAYIDYAVGHTTSEVSALLAGYISNMTDAMMHTFNSKIFTIPQAL